MVDLYSKTNGSISNGVKKNNEEIITSANFTKTNKTKSELMRCFLVSNILYLRNLKTNTSLVLDENNTPIYKKYLKEIGLIINENFLIFSGKAGEKSQVKINEAKNNINSILEEICKDVSFIEIMSNLNEYSFDDLKLLYTISKVAISLSVNGESAVLKSYIFTNLNKLLDSILKNIQPTSLKYESVVYIVCKVIRLLFKYKIYLDKTLSFELFKKLYDYSNSEKFVVSSEVFKTLIYIVTNPKVDVDKVNYFLETNKINICNLFYTTLVSADIENYLVKRETLILINQFVNKVFENNRFYSFKEYFTNDVNNLKMILIQLNDECLKIKLESINILYYFFVDISSETIIKILLSNKLNFYQFFQELEKEITEENSNFIEKRNCIYYELEKLENSNN